MLLPALIAIRIVINPFTNATQKVLSARRCSPPVQLSVSYAVLAALGLAILAAFPVWHPTHAFLINLFLLSLCDIAGNWMLIEAVRRSELGVFGPVNAYKAVVSMLFAFFMLGELPGARAIAGVLLIVAGSAILYSGANLSNGGPLAACAAQPPSRSRFRRDIARFFADAGVRWRLLSLLVLSLAAVFLKKCALLAPLPDAFAWWAIGGCPVAALAAWSYERRMKPAQPRGAGANWGLLLILAFTFGLGQFCTIATFRALPVSVSLALFQISAILSVLIGRQFFDERGLLRKLSGSLVMIAGALLAGG